MSYWSCRFSWYFNVIRVTLITDLVQTTDQRKLRKHGFLRPQDMSLTENSNQAFLPRVGEHDSFLYAISKVIICTFGSQKVDFIRILSFELITFSYEKCVHIHGCKKIWAIHIPTS